MEKVLSREKINYILLQMIIITFVCLVLFIDLFIERELLYLRIGLQTLALTVFLIYEIILFYVGNKAKKRKLLNIDEDTEHTKGEEEPKSFNEKYLWFEMLLLIDTIFIVSIITTLFENINLMAVFLISLAVYYVISIMMKPYFGINHNKNEDKE